MAPVETLIAGIAALNAMGILAMTLASNRKTDLVEVETSERRRRCGDAGPRGERVRFLKAWARAPLRIAAVAPSGQALARLMTQDLSALSGPVIELGPGTGAFTRAILAAGVKPEDLTLVEAEPSFVVDLRHRFAPARVVCMDAAELSKLPAGAPAGAVVSGLPLLSMPPHAVEAVLTGAFAAMRPDGVFLQFTYGPRCPIRKSVLAQLGLEAERVGGTLANVPPAAVYRIRRAPSVEASEAL